MISDKQARAIVMIDAAGGYIDAQVEIWRDYAVVE